MIKTGYKLFAAFANGRWFRFQARSPQHFVSMCCGDERARGWNVEAKHRGMYLPDFEWRDDVKMWYMQGKPYGKRLPCDR